MKLFAALAITSLALPGAWLLSAGGEEWRRSTDATAIVENFACIPMTPTQAHRAELALEVLDNFPRSSPIFDGAMNVLGLPTISDDRAHAHCISEEMKQRVTGATLKSGAWDHGLAGLSDMMLARQLGPRDPKIVEHVAQSAFFSGPIPDAAFTDLRPEARSILASFGVAARPWKGVALNEMSDKDSLGTSAAQVAAASKDPSAVVAVADLLDHLLKSETGHVIPRERGKRAVELSYALGASSDAGRPYVGLLLELLRRDVQSLAPPFGLIERKPNEVCHALKQIGGAMAEQTLHGPECEPPLFLLPG